MVFFKARSSTRFEVEKESCGVCDLIVFLRASVARWSVAILFTPFLKMASVQLLTFKIRKGPFVLETSFLIVTAAILLEFFAEEALSGDFSM